MLAKVVAEQPQSGADDDPDGQQHMGRVSGHDEHDEDQGGQLRHPSWSVVEQVAQVGRQCDQGGVDEQLRAGLGCRGRHDHECQRGAAHELQPPCGEASSSQLVQMASKAALAVAAEEIVDEAERTEAPGGEKSQEAGPADRDRSPSTEGAAADTDGLDDEERQRQHDAGTGDEGASAVVAARQHRRREHWVQRHPEQRAAETA